VALGSDRCPDCHTHSLLRASRDRHSRRNPQPTREPAGTGRASSLLGLLGATPGGLLLCWSIRAIPLEPNPPDRSGFDRLRDQARKWLPEMAVIGLRGDTAVVVAGVDGNRSVASAEPRSFDCESATSVAVEDWRLGTVLGHSGDSHSGAHR
jgi:hypothetical protein